MADAPIQNGSRLHDDEDVVERSSRSEKLLGHLNELGMILTRAEAMFEQVNADIAGLVQKRRTLEQVIVNARRVVAANIFPATTSPAKAAPLPNVAPQPHTAPLWAAAHAILSEHGEPMTVGQITAALEQRGWSLSKNAREVVRLAVGRRSDVFERTDLGTYQLAEWSRRRDGGQEGDGKR